MEKYDHQAIEEKWQKQWLASGIYRAEDNSAKPKYYALVEFPFPSGDGLHTGHIRSYTALDIIARKRRMQDYNVLYPMGWDAFGLPTENYAIKTGKAPQLVTQENTDNFRKQLRALGVSFDWSREINTTDPAYYKWTQWLFLQFYKHGLAYKQKTLINWCPKDKIGLANEEVVDGKCERCGTAVEQKEKEQWLLAITKYADRLDKDLDTVDYLPQIKTQQRNWIGRSEGAEIEFEINHPTPEPLPKGEGNESRGLCGYHTTDPKTWRELHDKAIEHRNNPTPAEEKLWEVLRNNATGSHFRRQHIIGRFITDFVCLEKSLVIEVDGKVHDYEKAYDQERTAWLEKLGFVIIRFKNEEILNDLESVKERINQKLDTLPFGEGWGGVIKVFTTRPETIYGATYVAVAGKTDRDTGKKVKNPATGEEIPVWEAEYVMEGVGTGAVMGVPAHDWRDWEFAEKHNLAKRVVLVPENPSVISSRPITTEQKNLLSETAILQSGPNPNETGNILINSGEFNGLTTQEARAKMTAKFGVAKTTYKLRDWIFSRQRYWGEPIPMISCAKCGWVPVPDEQLPVTLPEVKNYQPRDDGQSPLASIAEWVNTTCPECGGAAQRETDVMPNWAGSSWYYLRYMDPKNDKAFADRAKLDYWQQVDWYNGGMEHTTLHLLYSRFWHKFFYDIGLVPTAEPYAKRTAHGLIMAEDGEKMSKSRGNVVNPDEIVTLYGADTLRLYEMFMGPFNQTVAWSTESIIGPRRFLEKVWRLAEKVSDTGTDPEIEAHLQKVSDDIEKMSFNTAVSELMIAANKMASVEKIDRGAWQKFLIVLSLFAPHITAELWSRLGEDTPIHQQSWPSFDTSTAKQDNLTIVVQVNGVLRDKLEVAAGVSEEEVKNLALALPKIAKLLDGKEIKKLVYIPGKVLNIVL